MLPVDRFRPGHLHAWTSPGGSPTRCELHASEAPAGNRVVVRGLDFELP